MRSFNKPIHVGLYGRVSLVVNGEYVHLTGRTAQLLAYLASRRSTATSAEQLLDLFWPVAPASGLNVLQRQISSIRRQIRDADEPGAASAAVRYQDGSYWLNREVVSTDLDLLDDPEYLLKGPNDDISPVDVRWWLQPLVGLPYESFETIRVGLHDRALTAARSWLISIPEGVKDADIVEATAGIAERNPHDDLIWPRFRIALQGQSGPVKPIGDGRWSGNHHKVGTELALASRFRGLADAVAAWHTTGTATALDQLEKNLPLIRPDTARRARRWFTNLDPTDGLARSLSADILARAEVNPFDSERSLVSLDTYSLLSSPDGLERARSELGAADDEDEFLRCLRVLAFILLGAPLSEGLSETIGNLESVDSLEARAEAGRFRIAERIKKGRFEGIVEHLDEVQLMLDELGPGQGWFKQCVRVALHLHEPTRTYVPELDPKSRYLEASADQAVINATTLWHDLYRESVNASTPASLRQVANELPTPSVAAFEALHLVAIGRVHDASDLLRAYRGRLSTLPRYTWYHVLPVAAGVVAAATRDQLLADEVVDALLPWSGEHLGNFELIIEPTDNFLSWLKDVSHPRPSI